MGLLDPLANLLGTNAWLLAALVGLGFLFLAAVIFGYVFKMDTPVVLVLIIAVTALLWYFGLFPPIVIVVVAVFGGVLTWFVVVSNPSGRGGGEET